uniref:Uncharacterized protein n=1 Tax=Mustela putorius furo TaxID=9669 RepID=M3YAL8_MUSPF
RAQRCCHGSWRRADPSQAHRSLPRSGVWVAQVEGEAAHGRQAAQVAGVEGRGCGQARDQQQVAEVVHCAAHALRQPTRGQLALAEAPQVEEDECVVGADAAEKNEGCQIDEGEVGHAEGHPVEKEGDQQGAQHPQQYQEREEEGTQVEGDAEEDGNQGQQGVHRVLGQVVSQQLLLEAQVHASDGRVVVREPPGHCEAVQVDSHHGGPLGSGQEEQAVLKGGHLVVGSLGTQKVSVQQEMEELVDSTAPGALGGHLGAVCWLVLSRAQTRGHQGTTVVVDGTGPQKGQCSGCIGLSSVQAGGAVGEHSHIVAQGPAGAALVGFRTLAQSPKVAMGADLYSTQSRRELRVKAGAQVSPAPHLEGRGTPHLEGQGREVS